MTRLLTIILILVSGVCQGQKVISGNNNTDWTGTSPSLGLPIRKDTTVSFTVSLDPKNKSISTPVMLSAELKKDTSAGGWILDRSSTIVSFNYYVEDKTIGKAHTLSMKESDYDRMMKLLPAFLKQHHIPFSEH